MSASEIRNYALDVIDDIDGTIYVSSYTKNNAGWWSPIEVTLDMSASEIKEAIRMDVNGVYNGTTSNGYNVYVEQGTDNWSGEKVLRVYLLYGRALDHDIEL